MIIVEAFTPVVVSKKFIADLLVPLEYFPEVLSFFFASLIEIGQIFARQLHQDVITIIRSILLLKLMFLPLYFTIIITCRTRLIGFELTLV